MRPRGVRVPAVHHSWHRRRWEGHGLPPARRESRLRSMPTIQLHLWSVARDDAVRAHHYGKPIRGRSASEARAESCPSPWRMSWIDGGFTSPARCGSLFVPSGRRRCSTIPALEGFWRSRLHGPCVPAHEDITTGRSGRADQHANRVSKSIALRALPGFLNRLSARSDLRKPCEALLPLKARQPASPSSSVVALS